METRAPLDPNASVELSQDRSKMPVKSFPITQMIIVAVIAFIILGVALAGIYFLNSGETDDKSHVNGMPVQSDAINGGQPKNP